MNRRERIDAARLVAEWEWQQGGGSSEAAARSRCATELIETLRLTDEDLSFARAWEIANLAGIVDDPDMFDALDDFMSDKVYETTCDIIEEEGFAGLRAALEAHHAK